MMIQPTVFLQTLINADLRDHNRNINSYFFLTNITSFFSSVSW